MNDNSTQQTTYQKRALLLTLLLAIVAIGSLLWIWAHPAGNDTLIADIYQNGSLLHSIPLTSTEEAYTITITGENSAVNVIEVRTGSIGMISANCPDKLCIQQGFLADSLLPITCLPNRVVIQLRPEQTTVDTDDAETGMVPDMIAY